MESAVFYMDFLGSWSNATRTWWRLFVGTCPTTMHWRLGSTHTFRKGATWKNQTSQLSLMRILSHEVIGNWAEPLSDLMTTSRSSCTQLLSDFRNSKATGFHLVVSGKNTEACRYGVVTRNDRRRPWKSWSTRWGWDFPFDSLNRSKWLWHKHSI